MFVAQLCRRRERYGLRPRHRLGTANGDAPGRHELVRAGAEGEALPDGALGLGLTALSLAGLAFATCFSRHQNVLRDSRKRPVGRKACQNDSDDEKS